MKQDCPIVDNIEYLRVKQPRTWQSIFGYGFLAIRRGN